VVVCSVGAAVTSSDDATVVMETVAVPWRKPPTIDAVLAVVRIHNDEIVVEHLLTSSRVHRG
jgi:hypothetical protein